VRRVFRYSSFGIEFSTTVHIYLDVCALTLPGGNMSQRNVGTHLRG
jgi:hypothetical protein